MVRNLPTNAGDSSSILRFKTQVREYPLEEEMQPTPVFLPQKPHGQRSLVDCSPLGLKESDTTEQLSTQAVYL